LLNDALKLLRQKAADHIDARDTERGTLLAWPWNPKVQVDGDEAPYEADKLVFAEYLLERRIEKVKIEVETGPKEVAGTTLTGSIVIPSPLKSGDRVIVSRLTGQRYYVHGKDVISGG